MKPLIFTFVVGCLVVALTGNLVAAEEDVLLIYSFEEGKGETTKDISKNGNDGTLQGDAIWTKDGKFGGGVFLDGEGDFMDCGENNELQLVDTDFTLAAWVYPTALSQQSFGGGTGGTIFQTIQNAGGLPNQGFLIGIRDTGLLWWWNAHNLDKFSVSKVPLNKWTHVVVAFKFKGGGDNTLDFYLNGDLDFAATKVPDMKPTKTNMCVGHRSWCMGWFKGVIDEARVYTKMLNRDEISRVMETDGKAVDAKGKLTTIWGALKPRF